MDKCWQECGVGIYPRKIAKILTLEWLDTRALNFQLLLKVSSLLSVILFQFGIKCSVFFFFNLPMLLCRRRLLCVSNRQGTQFHPSSNILAAYTNNTPKCKQLWIASRAHINYRSTYHQLSVKKVTAKSWQTFEKLHNHKLRWCRCNDGHQTHRSSLVYIYWCIPHMHWQQAFKG